LLEDAQGGRSSMSYVLSSDAVADRQATITALKALTNARIISATASRAIELLTITNNTAVAANNETVKIAALLRMEGIDVGSPFQNYAQATIAIPAPIGDLIPYVPNGANNAELTNIANKVLSRSGVAMTRIVSLKYKGRR
jgi:hypothetical protein